MIDEVIELFAVNRRYLDDLPVEEVNSFLSEMLHYVKTSNPEIYDSLKKENAFTPETETALGKAIETYKSTRK